MGVVNVSQNKSGNKGRDLHQATLQVTRPLHSCTGDCRVDVGGLSVSLYTSNQIDTAFLYRWHELTAVRAWANPFYQPGMLARALSVYGHQDNIRLLTVTQEQEGKLIGLMPLVMGSSYGKFPIRYFQTWRHVHFYNGMPLIRENYEAAFLCAIGKWIDAKPDGARFIRFRFMPVAAHLRTNIERLRSGLQIEQSFERALLSGGQDFGTLMASVYSTKKRKELRRQFRRLNDLGALRMESVGTFDGRTSSGADEADQVINDYMTLESKGWKGKSGDSVRDPEHATFFASAMRDAFERGNALAICLIQEQESGEKPIAMVLCLRDGAEACAYKTTYDEELAAFSPGIHVLMEATRLVLARPDIEVFDSCAKPNHPVADRLWPQRRTIADIVIPADDSITHTVMSIARMGANTYKTIRAVMTRNGGGV